MSDVSRQEIDRLRYAAMEGDARLDNRLREAEAHIYKLWQDVERLRGIIEPLEVRSAELTNHKEDK